MAKRSPARQKLINAALELFASQGVTETTTRQIAERAGVNEVTLFRQFGNKHGLLLSALEETEVFTNIARSLAQEASEMDSLEQALRDYVDGRLQALEAMPEFVRSLVGEAGQYPIANRQSLGRELTQANRFVAQYLLTAMKHGPFQTRLPSEKLASLLNSVLLGYAVLEFTSEFHQLWDDRQDFVEHVVSLFLYGAVHQLPEEAGLASSHHDYPRDAAVPVPVLEMPVMDVAARDISARQTSTISPSMAPPSQGEGKEAASADSHANSHANSQTQTTEPSRASSLTAVADLSAHQVHELLKQAKAQGPQAFALLYVLFGAGLSTTEISQLQLQHHVFDGSQHLLQIPHTDRLVPINQWILGKRYGSATKNPLTQWLKNRKDDQSSLFLGETGALTLAEIQAVWQQCLAACNDPIMPGELIQAQQTWRIDMLMRGISAENLSLLTGASVTDLQPFVQRARVKQALKQAAKLDRKPGE